MSIKKTMLAAAMAAFAFAALPAFAAAQPVLDIPEGGSGQFSLSGGASELLTESSKVECTGVTGEGEFEGNPSTTGTIEFSFTGCKSSGTSCGTEKYSTGEIETTPLTFHLVTATDNEDVTGQTQNGPVDAVLITPNEPDPETTTGHFATFRCAFGLVKVEVDGTGVIGAITDPATNGKSNTFEVEFGGDTEATTQTYEHIEVNGQTSEHTYDLEAKVGSGAFKTALQVGSGKGTFAGGSKNTLT